MGIQITGVGAYSPSKVVTNHDLAQTIDTSHEWIVAHTGIEARRISAPEPLPSAAGLLRKPRNQPPP